MYTGYKELVLSEEDFNCLYSQKSLSLDNENLFVENEYLIAKESEKGESIDFFKYQNGNFEQVKYQTIRSDFLGEIKPRNPYQRLAIDCLKDKRSGVKVIGGCLGSGQSI